MSASAVGSDRTSPASSVGAEPNRAAQWSPRDAVADPARVAAVASYRVQGHAGDPDLDAVVGFLAGALRVPVALIDLVGPDRQCYPAEYGLGMPETHLPDEQSFCAYVVALGAPLSVPDAREHPVFASNPVVAAGMVRSYLGVPLIDDEGFVLGALGVFDVVPRAFSDEDRALLEVQTRLVRTVLALRRQLAAHEWDTGLLVAQGRALEAVATGQPLEQVLGLLTATVQSLAPHAGAEQLGVLHRTIDRLTTIAADADRWRHTMLRVAQQDPLTGLANRSYLVNAGSSLLAGGAAVLFLDVDKFKEVNDRGGHAVGDQLLVRLAHRLRASVEDVVPDAVVGRLGGDEFAAVLPGLDRSAALQLGERLVDLLVEQVEVGRRTVGVSVSVGLAMAEPGADLVDVLREADLAMYRAKHSGRGALATAGDTGAPESSRAGDAGARGAPGAGARPT